MKRLTTWLLGTLLGLLVAVPIIVRVAYGQPPYAGTFPLGYLVYMSWDTNLATGASAAPTVAPTLKCSLQTSAGTLLSAESMSYQADFYATGIARIGINTGNAFFAAGNEYLVWASAATIDSLTVNRSIAAFSLRPTPANMVQAIGTTLTEAGGAGRLAAAMSTWGNVATPVATAASVNQAADSNVILAHADYGLAKLVRSTTPANTLSVDAANKVPATIAVADVAGALPADLTAIHGTALTETAGQLAARFVGFFDQAANGTGFSAATALADMKANVAAVAVVAATAPTAAVAEVAPTALVAAVAAKADKADTAAVAAIAPTAAVANVAPTAAVAATAAVAEVAPTALVAAVAAVAAPADLWNFALPGACGDGTAGKILGANLDTTVGSRLATTGYTAPPSGATIAGLVLDEAKGAHAGFLTTLSIFAPATDKVYLGNGAHGGAAATLTLGGAGGLTANITGNLSGSVGSLTTWDKAGYGLSAAGVDAIIDEVVGGAVTLRTVIDSLRTKLPTDSIAGKADVQIIIGP